MIGWFVTGIAKTSTGTFPILQMVVIMPRPTWDPLLPYWAKPGSSGNVVPEVPISPVTMSGPGLRPSGTLCGAPGAEVPELLLKRKSSGSATQHNLFLNLAGILPLVLVSENHETHCLRLGRAPIVNFDETDADSGVRSGEQRRVRTRRERRSDS